MEVRAIQVGIHRHYPMPHPCEGDGNVRGHKGLADTPLTATKGDKSWRPCRLRAGLEWRSKFGLDSYQPKCPPMRYAA